MSCHPQPLTSGCDRPKEESVNPADAIMDQLACQAARMAADEVDPKSQQLMFEIAERYEALARRARERPAALMKDRD